MGHEEGLHIPCLYCGWHGRKGLKGGGEKVGNSAGGEMVERVLRDGGIFTGVDVPVSRQSKYTAAQITAGQP